MSVTVLAPQRAPVPPRRLAPVNGPRLLLPPVVEPRTGPDPREIVLLHPVTRSVLAPAVEQDWPVPAADPASRTEPGDPRQLAAAVVLAAVEALSGTRPLFQLTRWVSPEVLEALAARVPRTPPTPRLRARVRSTRTCQLSSRVVEATVVVHDGAKVRAAAARLELHRRRWRVSVLQIG